MSTNNSTIQPTTNQKFHLKTIQNKSMLDVSLNAAIRNSSVKSFLKNSSSISKQNEYVDDVGDVDLQRHLLQLKKSCSQLTKQIKNKEIQSHKFKDQTSFALENTKKIKLNRQKLQEKINELNRNLQTVNNKRQAAFHASKTYEHILQRMKKDDIYKQLQKNQLQRELKGLQKNHSLTEAKNYSAIQLQKLSLIGLKDAHQQLSDQQILRKNNLNSVNKQSSKKQDKQNKLKQRQKQTDQIQQLAACDIQDADLLRLKKFMTVQMFLRQLLKSKMAKLKQYYLPYEDAFFQIKSNTSVKDASSLKSQFFNFQTSYNEKTVWVKFLQNDIDQCEQQKNKLKQKLIQLRNQQIQIVEQMETQQKIGQVCNIKQLNTKSMQFQLIWQRIQSWMSVNVRKLKIQTSNKDPQFIFKQMFQKLKSRKTSSTSQKKQEPQAEKNQQIQV